jgi:hypothetical protein
VDRAEKHVAEFLRRRGHTFDHEPDGNIPPDFLVDKHIAVEVQRLIQTETGTTTLAETAIPLSLYLKKLTLESGAPTHGASWYLYYRFCRPIDLKKLKPDLKRQLDAFREGGIHEKKILNVGDSFKLEIYPAPHPRETFFVMMGCSDQDGGGFLFDEIRQSATNCIANKTDKIKQYRAKYSVWWLVFVDFIAYWLDDSEVEQFKSDVSIPHPGWDKVIVLHPTDPTRFFEI